MMLSGEKITENEYQKWMQGLLMMLGYIFGMQKIKRASYKTFWPIFYWNLSHQLLIMKFRML